MKKNQTDKTIIGLATPFNIYNYGTKLQAYALQELVSDLGYDCEIIKYESKFDLTLKSFFVKLWFKISKFVNRISMNVFPKEVAENIEKRKTSIDSFNKKYKVSTNIRGFKSLMKYAERYSAVICGSDQVWKHTNLISRFYTLEFVNSDTGKISYAPSFGTSTLPAKYINRYRGFLKCFDYISIRESSGVEILSELIDGEIRLVLDPTLVVQDSLWGRLVEESNYDTPEEFIFCYFLGDNVAHRRIVKELAKKHRLPIINLAHMTGFNQSDIKFADIDIYGISPDDFLKIIKRSSFVFTDSYHGSIFSIIFKKEFYVFERYPCGNPLSTNTRLENLLNLLSVSDRMIKNDALNEIYSIGKIDYVSVYSKLAEHRMTSMDFLTTSLKEFS